MDEKLIEKVKERELLFNTFSLDYLNTIKRNLAWDEIGRELEISAEVAKEKWQILRRCYANALHRRRNKASKYKNLPPWKYDRQMEFILPYIEKRNARSTLRKRSNVAPTETIIEKIVDVKLEEVDLREDNSVGNCEQELPNVRKCPELRNTKYEVLKIMKENLELRRNIHEDRLNRISLFESLDETDMFFLSMSKMTKHLDRFEQSKIKLQLSNAVLQAEMKQEQARASSSREHSH